MIYGLVDDYLLIPIQMQAQNFFTRDSNDEGTEGNGVTGGNWWREERRGELDVTMRMIQECLIFG